MQQVNPFGDLGVAALEEEDLVTIRGGLGLLGTLAAGLIVAVLVEFDEFVEGFKEGFAYARGGQSGPRQRFRVGGPPRPEPRLHT